MSIESPTAIQFKLNEVEIIINDLLITTMKDYINETKNQLSIYMGDYLSI